MSEETNRIQNGLDRMLAGSKEFSSIAERGLAKMLNKDAVVNENTNDDFKIKMAKMLPNLNTEYKIKIMMGVIKKE